ncbi:MAG: histidine kinase [Actinomycetota bacterium]|nr:histidine kinase [Actinomycetota bacterium]
MRSRHDSATRFVIAIVTVGLIALLVVLISGVAVIRQLAETQAIEQARALTQLDARLVERRITDQMIDPANPLANGRLAILIEQTVLTDPAVKRVKIWDRSGKIVYSDLPELMERPASPLGEDELRALRTGEVIAEVDDLEEEENETEQGLTGPITEVYTKIRTPEGKSLLFETYQSSEAIANAGREIAGNFTPVLILTLTIAAAFEGALAVALIRRFRRNQREREALMEAAMEASFRERRRIAGDLHDGPVQELAGLALGLSAQAQAATDQRTRESLLRAAKSVRSNLRTLRSAIVGVYPPNLEQMGLEAALSDLLARLPSHQISAHLRYQLDADLAHDTSELLYRTSQEAIRNVEKHAGASNVWITVARQNGQVSLAVQDDGRGGASVNDQVGESGRFGLAVLADIIKDAGGQMQLTSNGTGTTVQVEVPA